MSHTTPRSMKPGGAKWKAVVERDGGEVCAYCGTTEGLLMDHKVPRSRGGSDDVANLQILCAACNSKKGPMTEAESSKHVRHASGVAQAGFTLIPNAVLLNNSLSLGARMFYGVLKSYAWQRDECWPGQESVASALGISVRALRAYGKELVDAKLVRVSRRGRGLTNVYVILEPSSDRQKTTHLDRQEKALPERQETTPEVDEVKETSVSPSGETAPSGRDFVGFFVDESRRVTGADPLATAKARLGRDAGKLAKQDVSPETIRAAITELVEAGLGVGSFLGVADQMHRGGYRGRNGHRTGLAAGDLAARARELEREGR